MKSPSFVRVISPRRSEIQKPISGEKKAITMGKSTETPARSNASTFEEKTVKSQKPPFRPAVDDTKPVLQDPILRSDPMETEEAVLRLPPFPVMRPSES